jgi:hypothetical protein
VPYVRATEGRANDSQTLGDPTIRAGLRLRLFSRHAREGDTVLLEELGLRRGQVRIDLAVVNGSLHGYEIKSDRDNLRRLATQVDVYGKVLDRATLVVGDRFLDEALDVVPSWWGVLHVGSASRALQFRTVRRSRKNPQRDPRALVELLWFDQAIALLEERNAARGVRGKPRRVVWDRVCDCFGVDEIAAAVRSRLKTRATHQARA